MSDHDATYACRICQQPTSSIGHIDSRYSGRHYELRQCAHCGFSFVANPWTDYPRIYDERYYAGRGADRSVDYQFELEQPERTVRAYEWRGILGIVSTLVPMGQTTRWLDFGCGNGGLVRYVRATAGCEALGFEDGAIAADARRAGVPVIEPRELDTLQGSFDVVTAIEVIEHVTDPLAVLRQIRGLLKNGGLCFLTTGNAAPFRRRLRHWSYVLPDVHVSFFEPSTLAMALRLSGFRPEPRGALPGYDDVIRFKVLKSLGVRRRGPIEALLPWGVIGAIVDRRLGVSAHPIGWAA